MSEDMLMSCVVVSHEIFTITNNITGYVEDHDSYSS